MSEKQENLYNGVCDFYNALISSHIVSQQDTFEDKLLVLEDLTSSFFTVCVILNDNKADDLKCKYNFLHQIMAHAVYCDFHKKRTLEIKKLDKNRILDKFNSDVEEAKKSGDLSVSETS